MAQIQIQMQTQEEEEEQIKKQENENENENASSGEVVVRWEKFLPRMALRVLLVEADDSTRQIISALLRKCSYRVAAVSDGLKAWETLKNKAPDIDLILTEVELPSISGFSLLTLIMEHDICKGIPVIMMSSNDSVSMVFKCMLKGAADFLIKPVRRNELRNLWQHVWRRHATGRPTQSLTLAQNKLEGGAESNAESNNSSGSMASMQKNIEYNEKTSEAQSTCTSSFLEAENAYMENMQDTSKPKSSSNLINIGTVKQEESAKHNDEAGEKSTIFVSEASRCNKTSNLTSLRLDQNYDYNETENQDEDLRKELSKANPPHTNTEVHGCSKKLAEPSREAIDLIATIENIPKNTDENCGFNGDNAVPFNFDTQLKLSLRRDFPGSSRNHATEERQRLNHSNASAFYRYSSSKLLQPLFPTPSNTSAKSSNVSCNSQESNKLYENANPFHQYDSKNQNQNLTTLIIAQSRKVEPESPSNQLGFFPAAGTTSDYKSMGHGNVLPSMLSAAWTPKSVFQKEGSPFPTSASSQSNPESHNLERHCCSDEATYTSDQNLHDQSNLDCGRLDSPAAGKNAGTSLYLENHDSSGAYGSRGSNNDANATSALVANFPEKYDGFRGTDSHRTSLREAALNKFRLKRKDRCYEKKVRYQSRKRLAEQRPRVKGQFVRQAHNDNSVADAGGGS